MRQFFVISVMFRDRVGIVADVSSAIRQLNGNLADVSQTVMRGYFTMILLAAFPEGVTEDVIRAAMHEIKGLSGAQIGVIRAQEQDVADNAGNVPDNIASDSQLYVLTASGPDQPGLVMAFSGYLRERNVNIIDLASVVERGEYTMVWLINLPAGTDVRNLKQDLEQSLGYLNMKIGLRNQAIFHRTNEI